MQESFLRWMARSTGPIGVVLLLMSFYMIALVAWMFFEYRRPNAVPERLVGDLNNLLDRRSNTRSAFERLCTATRRSSAGCWRRASASCRAASRRRYRAMQLVNDDVTMEMEHRTTYLATVGTLGPLIGLFGTVYGMIIAFRVMSASRASRRPSQLAGGISTAPVRHPAGHRRGDPGDHLLRHLPQPDRPALAGGRAGGRGAARAVRPGAAAPAPARHRRRRSIREAAPCRAPAARPVRTSLGGPRARE